MKKASSKKPTRKITPKKRSFFYSKNVRWFGVDIHHIALGVSVVGCIVALLLVQKQKMIEEEVLAARTGIGVPYVRVGGVIPTCIPRPPCLDATPKCEIAEPADGWCPGPLMSNGTPTPSITPPPGCFYRKICLMIMCTRNNPNCQPCHNILVCPSGTPRPSIVPPITCPPNPTCPAGKMCPQYMRWCFPNITVTPPVHPSCNPTPTCDPRKGILCKLPCGITQMPHPVVSTKITGSVPVGSQPANNPFTSSSLRTFFTSFVSKFFSFF